MPRRSWSLPLAVYLQCYLLKGAAGKRRHIRDKGFHFIITFPNVSLSDLKLLKCKKCSKTENVVFIALWWFDDGKRGLSHTARLWSHSRQAFVLPPPLPGSAAVRHHSLPSAVLTQSAMHRFTLSTCTHCSDTVPHTSQLGPPPKNKLFTLSD